jgi:hypothetical protein
MACKLAIPLLILKGLNPFIIGASRSGSFMNSCSI